MKKLISLAALIAGILTIFNMMNSSEPCVVRSLAGLSGGLAAGFGYGYLTSKQEQ